MYEKKIYLAGGCFWGTQAYMRQLPGVLDTQVGYANSRFEQPNYEDVCTGDTEAAECVRVTYDADVIGLSLLLEAFLRTIDPYAVNQQGNDRGTQYRTGIWWTDEAGDDAFVVRSMLAELQYRSGRPVAVEAARLESFWPAEDYHQNYLQKNPTGYCHVNLADARQFIADHAGEFGRINRVVKLEPPSNG